MRTNGFIFIAFCLTAGPVAGAAGYLPGVGPVALRFERAVSHRVTLPAPGAEATPQAGAGAVVREDFTVELPVEPPTAAPTTPLMQEAPIVAPAVGPEPQGTAPVDPSQPLVSPMMEVNGVVTPQMFLRFFTRPQDGVSGEAVIAVPPGFNPARPPTTPSTATYTQSPP